MKHAKVLLFAAVIVYASWMGMLVTHELGHILHAWLTGGLVTEVYLPLTGFSQTWVEPNPQPHFVVWGGPIWGSILPLGIWLLFRQLHWKGQNVVRYFAGFCCIANGAYIGIGWIPGAGDAADLQLYGTPVWAMIGFGVLCASVGLYLWHGLGTLRNLLSSSST